MLSSIREYLFENITCAGSGVIITLLLVAITALSATLFYYAAKELLLLLEKLIMRSPTQWDDDLITPRFLKALSQLAPAICVRWMLPSFFQEDDSTFRWLSSLTSLYIVAAVVVIIVIIIGNLYGAVASRESLKRFAVKGIFQMFKIIVISIGAIVGISIILGISPTVVVTSLGASAAVLMLVFKDTILGLVASVQLTGNKMLREGDWIVSDKNNANGEVIDVSLTTIKVRNWDNSISTIPPYSLVTESFRNYEEMRRIGARRVDRSFFIDANSVRFLTPSELAALAAEGWLDEAEAAAARTVNFGLLRRYLVHYLRSHPEVVQDATLMVRQLEPTPSGLPLQLYFFTSRTKWEDFEALQSDISDYVYAVVGRFGLRIFQTPAGNDISRLARIEE